MRNVLIFMLALLLLGGCEIFGLRDADLPSAPAPWNDFTSTWEQCVQNLGYCYTDERNLVKYTGLFRTDYRFTFSPQDIQEHNITQVWDRAVEQDMLINLHNQSQKITLELAVMPDNPDDISASEAKIYRSYTISVKTSEGLENFSGNMELQLRKDYGYWYIYRWYDYRSGNLPGWGRLKYDYWQ
ncbi:MAG TPA: hypothetical protein P5533_08590 [Candidatus Cloacimonadota bacterium]|nr:hypothetical protein [Candidatus Cloacimonadota bacterium]